MKMDPPAHIDCFIWGEMRRVMDVGRDNYRPQIEATLDRIDEHLRQVVRLGLKRDKDWALRRENQLNSVFGKIERAGMFDQPSISSKRPLLPVQVAYYAKNMEDIIANCANIAMDISERTPVGDFLKRVTDELRDAEGVFTDMLLCLEDELCRRRRPLWDE
ncbi:hypothetical protein BO70DRAFT_433051 [Aspergillus heteromorphus CBS 117.55]|uniref:Uncharacterized protein n=1 Tax=Aspergillus heteromorphus CBS 117.55 TaxID=1448321 RepID=A0A317V0X9_9EURO|nr:uncharacterized protein BO70DRAFT_433051 [Aspergillus heteromorphus CBS 117.55]PWY66728.1 hypothetical protein BO70DRAFT_433051 [Aspergillus heteromorphus CBS 117.55]